VAGLATQFLMPTVQWKLGVLVMRKVLFFPFLFAMTIFALLAHDAPMLVIDPVTVVASHGDLSIALIGMTGPAGRVFMLPPQRKIRLRMIETRLLAPTCRRMALLALLTQFAAMRVILLVTGDTRGRRLTIDLMFLVAIGTADKLMSSLERKIRLIMTESRGIQARDIRRPTLMLGMAI